MTVSRIQGGGLQSRLISTPMVSVNAQYAPGDAVGDKMVFGDAADDEGTRSGVIQTVTLVNRSLDLTGLSLVLFDSDFSATADNAEFALPDGELLNCLGVVPIDSGSYTVFKDNCVATITNVGLSYKFPDTGPGGTAWNGPFNLSGQLIARGTPTYASTSDLTVILGVFKD
jgi:hypothetical protein